MKSKRRLCVALALFATLCSFILMGVQPGAVATTSGGSGEDSSDSRTVLLRNRHHYGGGSTVGYIGMGGTSFKARVTVASRGGAKPSKTDIRKAVEKQGVKVTSVGKVRGFTKKFKVFNAKNYRHNLSMRTGYSRVEADAHHIMPRKFEPYFSRRGINIHHPANMEWWYRPSHAKFADRYNRQWKEWVKSPVVV